MVVWPETVVVEMRIHDSFQVLQIGWMLGNIKFVKIKAQHRCLSKMIHEMIKSSLLFYTVNRDVTVLISQYSI